MKGPLKVFLALLVVFLLGLSGDQNNSPSNTLEKQKGICYAAWQSGVYSTPDSDISLVHLAETGADWISLIVTCYQDTLSSTRIYASPSTPTDEDLIHVIRQARALGLKVMLKPHVDLWNDPLHWRGEIGTDFRSEAEWTDWFASYRSFIEHYADLASTYGSDQFCVGTELEGTTARAAEWRKVVAEVRARYGGPLIYAANHSGEETSLTWWDAVDFIGVDAYYALATKNDPTVAELKAAWQPHISALADLATAWQKPVILTEIGYRSIDGTASHPWDWQVQGEVDLEEQADAYQAAFESVYNQPWFAGIYWWSWGPDPLEGGPGDDGYSPHDKPAEEVLRSWFGAPPRRVSPSGPQSNDFRFMDIFADALGSGWMDQSWDAEHELAAADQAYTGKYSLRVRLSAWGALSFWHPPFASQPYFWLEFSIRSSSPGELPQLWAYFYDRNGAVLHKVPVNDRRYIEEGTAEPGSWTIVSIPLQDLGASRTVLSRLSLQDNSGRGTSGFWIDDLRLVGARWKERPTKPGKKQNHSPLRDIAGAQRISTLKFPPRKQ
jgi:hypothetical protein